jgi:hypothetical protein
MPSSFRPSGPSASSGVSSSGVSSAEPLRLEYLSRSYAEASRCTLSWGRHLDASYGHISVSEEPQFRLPRPPLDSLVSLGRAADSLAESIALTAARFRRADARELIEAWSRDANSAWKRAVEQQYRGPAPRPGWKAIRFATTDRGRFVEVSGDLTSATHVVVLVPGMTNELATVDALRARADRLLGEMKRRAQPGQRVVVILWMGYRTPGRYEPWEAVSNDMARVGSQTLVDDLAAWRTVSNADFTVVAHSYGTVVVGEAMKRGLPADRVVALGSPGISAKNRAALGSPKVDLYASSITKSSSAPAVLTRLAVRGVGARTPLIVVTPLIGDVLTGRDWASATSRYRVHGNDPASTTFGATVFPSSGSGHDAYFDPGSTGLSTTADIGLGRR